MPLRSGAPVRPGTRRGAVAALAALAAPVLLAACTASSPPPARLDGDVEVQEDITYWTGDDAELQLDACLPTGADAATPAVLLVHGGGFTGGDRASEGMRALCRDTARAGAAAFSVDYRLAPENPYPAQVEDLANAVRWLREPAQVERFGIDPERIGAIGSSAGAIIAQTLATRGEGPTTSGARLGAVASLSGVSVLTTDGRQLGEPDPRAVQIVLDYLGCESPEDCPQSEAASPVSAVDPTDPPMLLVNGTDELVPQEQADAMAEALDAAGVPVEVVTVDGPQHGVSLLNADVRRALYSFLEESL